MSRRVIDMSHRSIASLVILVALCGPASARRLRAAGEELIQVVAPTSRAVAAAHPHVNVILSFGTAKDGTPADPSTFRAKLNGKDVTSAFHSIVTNGVETGLRAALPQPALRLGNAPRNRLRLAIQGVKAPGAKGPRPRDVDRLRFGAADSVNRPPVVMLAADSDITAVGLPVAFDATGSQDPDLDELTFDWSFSDGGTASGAIVTHAFASAGEGIVSATVAVSDGVVSVPETRVVPIKLEPDPGRTPGVLRVEAAGPLEFSAVGLGATATRSLIVRNVDSTPTSQLKIRALLSNGGGFGVAPATLIDMGPDGSATIDVAFAPTATGHASANLTLVASASNRGAVSFLAHAYGGVAPGDGPTLVAVPVFASLPTEMTRLAPDGTRASIAATIGSCAGGTGPSDACVLDGDCGGGGVCSAATYPIDVTDMCSDAQSLFVLSEATYTEPRESAQTDLSGTLVRFDLDAGGAVTGREVLYRTTEDTDQLACDGFRAGTGGLTYLAEFHNVDNTDACERDERDALVAVNKATGGSRTVDGLAHMDQAAGVGDCEFPDAVAELAVAPDGVNKYASFDTHGLWRIAPVPRFFTPDVRELFQVHPDGSIAFVVARDRGTVGSIDLYRLTESQVEHGALPVSALTPCASVTVPNNTTDANHMMTTVTSMVLGPASFSGSDATVLATFHAWSATPPLDVLPPYGDLRGTVAFSLPSATTTCSALGLVNLQASPLYR
jgi:hypothetical protein